MEKKDILLIYPPYTYPKKSPPIGLAYVAAYLEREGYSVRIMDMAVTDVDDRALKSEIMRTAPRLVGISFMTNQFREAVRISNIVKEVDRNITVAAGGPHVSALPGEILALGQVDIAVIGEGEETMAEVMGVLLNSKSGGLGSIRGVAYKKDGKVNINAPRGPVRDPDSLPFPAWHLLPLDGYSVPCTGGDAAEHVYAVISSRGCPNNCVFCDSHTVFGKRFRGRTARNIFDELLYLNRNFRASQFDFVDDTVTADKNRMLELCRLILEGGHRFKWMCNSRANTVDPEMLGIMKKAGCVRIEFGVESGDERVLRLMKKGVTIEEIKDAHRFAREAGLGIGSFVMVGNMGEDIASVEKTNRLLRELETDDVYVSIATPFPGTELYGIARENGWLRTADWSEYVTAPTYFPGYSPVMKTDKMGGREILKAFFYLYSQFAGKKFRTRYGKTFFLNGRFYRDNLSVRNYRELKHKARLAKNLIGSYFQR